MWEMAKEAIKNSSPESSVYIGADSQCHKRRRKNAKGEKYTEFYADYAIVVILHHDSNHGAEIFHNIETQPDYGNIRMRMISEVGLSVMTALEMKDVIGDRHFEIHLDINPSDKYKSNSAVKEALGYVRGVLGVEAKIKPDAPAASYAADHCVKKKFKKAKAYDNMEKEVA